MRTSTVVFLVLAAVSVTPTLSRPVVEDVALGVGATSGTISGDSVVQSRIGADHHGAHPSTHGQAGHRHHGGVHKHVTRADVTQAHDIVASHRSSRRHAHKGGQKHGVDSEAAPVPIALQTRGYHDDEDLLVRAFQEKGLFARGFDGELLARTLENDLVARKIDWKKLGSTALKVATGVTKFLTNMQRSEDPQLLGRGYHDDEELLARAFEDEGLSTRDFDGELFARTIHNELVARRIKIDWKKVGRTAFKVAEGVGKLLLHMRSEEPESME